MTTKKITHTPGSWRLDGRTVVALKTRVVAMVPSDHVMQFPVDEANAAFIVRACNNFDGLLEAAEAAYQQLAEVWGRLSIDEDHPRRMAASLLSIQRFLAMTAAQDFQHPAIAKAKGDQL